MDLRAVILATISSVQALGCTGPCPKGDPFTRNQELTRAQMDEVFPGRMDRCEAACELALSQSLNITELDACHLEVDEDYVPSDPDETGDTASDEEVVGSVSCSGVAAQECLGRRPLADAHRTATRVEGRLLFGLAALEHASVAAFLELESQLERFGAPERLIERCRRAAQDEILHTALLCDLGGIDPSTLPGSAAPRVDASPYEVAAHNAVEGCVNECWAALLAAWQSAHAGDAAVRQVFRRIAADEALHGQLAWDVHRWFLGLLPPAQRDDLLGLQRAALVRLPIAAGHAAAWPAVLGFPTGSTATHLAMSFAATLVGHSGGGPG